MFMTHGLPPRRAACISAFLLAALIPTVGPCRADSPSERAATKLRWEVESRKAIEFRVRTVITRHGDLRRSTSQSFNVWVEHYIETATGRRFT